MAEKTDNELSPRLLIRWEIVDPDSRLEEAWTIVVPLVEADGGEVYLVTKTDAEVHVHLAGSCAGCPGSSLTQQHLFEPVLHRFLPKAAVKLTTGWIIPRGASRLRVQGDSVVTGEEVTLAAGSRPTASEP